MNTYLRKLRGVIAIGLIWAPVWAVMFTVLTIILQLFLPLDDDVGTIRIMLIIGWVGLISGGIFGLLLSFAENGRAIPDLSLARAALWGILSSAVFPVVTDRADQVFWTCTFGAVVGLALVALARKAAVRNTAHPRRLTDIFLAALHIPVRDAVG